MAEETRRVSGDQADSAGKEASDRETELVDLEPRDSDSDGVQGGTGKLGDGGRSSIQPT